MRNNYSKSDRLLFNYSGALPAYLRKTFAVFLLSWWCLQVAQSQTFTTSGIYAIPKGKTSIADGGNGFRGQITISSCTAPGMGIADPETKPGKTIQPLIWLVSDRILTAGTTINVDFRVLHFDDIASYQFALKFDPSILQFQQIEVMTNEIPIDAANNFGLYNIVEGEVRTLWSVAAGITLPTTPVVFRLRLTVLQGGSMLSDVLKIDPTIIPAVAYTTPLASRMLQLLYKPNPVLMNMRDEDDVTKEAAVVMLLQNRPNPFTEATSIGFILPEACDAQLRIFDTQSRLLLESSKWYPAGYSEEVIRLQDIKATGMLYYELTTPFGTQTRKMAVGGK